MTELPGERGARALGEWVGGTFFWEILLLMLVVSTVLIWWLVRRWRSGKF